MSRFARSMDIRALFLACTLIGGFGISFGYAQSPQIERAETRFGPVTVLTNHGDPDYVFVRFGNQIIKFPDEYGGHIEGQYQLQNEDVLIVSHTTGARGIPPSYSLFSIDSDGIQEKRNLDFGTSDYTFKVQKEYDGLLFDLGFEDGRIKTASYKNGVLSVRMERPAGNPQLSKDDCAAVLNYAAECKSKDDCRFSDLMDIFPMGVIRSLHTISNNPAFSIDGFERACANICRTRTYSVMSVRKQLCGY